jgi:hypothetical protein
MLTDRTGCQPNLDEYIEQCYPIEAARRKRERNERAQNARVAALEAYGKWYMAQQRLKTVQSRPVTVSKTVLYTSSPGVSYSDRLGYTRTQITEYTFASAKDAAEQILRKVYLADLKTKAAISISKDVASIIPSPLSTASGITMAALDAVEVDGQYTTGESALNYLDNGYQNNKGVVIMIDTVIVNGSFSRSEINVTVNEWTPYFHILTDPSYQ